MLKVRSRVEMEELLNGQDKIFSENVIKVFNVCVIIRKIEDRFNSSKWLKLLNESMRQDGYLMEIRSLLNERIRNIEIVYQSKKMVIFYPSHPLFDFLSANTKEQLLFTVNRETQREKILGLLDRK